MIAVIVLYVKVVELYGVCKVIVTIIRDSRPFAKNFYTPNCMQGYFVLGFSGVFSHLLYIPNNGRRECQKHIHTVDLAISYPHLSLPENQYEPSYHKSSSARKPILPSLVLPFGKSQLRETLKTIVNIENNDKVHVGAIPESRLNVWIVGNRSSLLHFKMLH